MLPLSRRNIIADPSALSITSHCTPLIQMHAFRVDGLLGCVHLVSGSRSPSLLPLEGRGFVGQELNHFGIGVSEGWRVVTLHAAKADSLLGLHQGVDGVDALHLVDGRVREMFAHTRLETTKANSLLGRAG